MSEEVKNEETPVEQPVAAPEAAPAEKPADDGVIEVDIPKENITVDQEVEEQYGDGLIESMLGYLKRYNGYNYVSCSRITDIPSDSKQLSMLMNMLVTTYMMRGNTSAEEFKKSFAESNIAYIQIHKTCPTIAADGLYTPNPDVADKKESPILAGRFLMSDPEKFKPVILLRTGPGKVGDPNTLGIIYGEPYHKVSAEEVAAVIKENQPNAAAPSTAE